MAHEEDIMMTEAGVKLPPPSTFEQKGPQIGFAFQEGELKSKGLWIGCAGEFLATFLFLFFSIATVNANLGLTMANFAPKSQAANFLMISLCFGFMITILVYAFADISGAHINPAVSIALTITKRCSPIRMCLYIVAQCLGASAGCATVKGVVGADNFMEAINQVSHKAGVHIAQGISAEIIGTFLLCFTVLSAVDANNNKPGRLNYRIMTGALGPLAIGLSVTVAHMVLIPLTNCSINPARSFGASAVAGDWPHHYVFWVGPIIGGILAAFSYEILGKIKDE